MEIKQCKGQSYQNNKCIANARNGLGTCITHNHQDNYTLEDMMNLTNCHGCRRMLSKKDKQCEICKDRCMINRAKKSEENKNKLKCVFCNKNNRSTENDYCGKHQIEYLKQIFLNSGKKVCSNFARCRNTLEISYNGKTCENCREKDRVTSKAKRNGYRSNNIKETNILNQLIDEEDIENIENVNDDVNDHKMKTKICTKCGKNKDIKMFTNKGNGKETKTCNSCRERGAKVDATRIDRVRNYGEEIKKNQQRKIKKDKWKDENYDKVARYWIKHRQKMLSELGIDEFLKRNAIEATKYRDKYPDYMIKVNEKNKMNDKYRFKSYQNRACITGKQFKLTQEECSAFYKGICYYCGFKYDETQLLTIDRIDNDIDYIKGNCTSACVMCNIMKGSLNQKIFIDICELIISNFGIIESEIILEIMPDKISMGYISYIQRAKNKKINFDLKIHEFNLITSNFCYLCNKPNSDNHINGIDRIDNNMGYVYTNCMSCCTTCNFIKNKYNLNDLIIRMIAIVRNLRYTNLYDIDDTLNGHMYNMEMYLQCDNLLVNILKKIPKSKNKENIQIMCGIENDSGHEQKYYNDNNNIIENVFENDINTTKNKLNTKRKISTHAQQIISDDQIILKISTEEMKEKDHIIKQKLYNILNEYKSSITISELDAKNNISDSDNNLTNVDYIKQWRLKKEQEIGKEKYKQIESEKRQERRKNQRAKYGIIIRKKMTKEEIKERDRLRKQKNKKELVDRYNNEDKLKEKINTIVEKHKLKKNNENK